MGRIDSTHIVNWAPHYVYHLSWPTRDNPIWDLTWSLGCAPEGLVLQNVHYRGKLVIRHASVPALRVQYVPFNGHRNLMFRDDLNSPDGSWVETYAGVATNAPLRYVAIDAYYDRGIGRYRILQRWTLWENGQISARHFSTGEQWPANHTHHVYWRFDFGFDGDNEVALEWEGTRVGDHGYRSGWEALEVEQVRKNEWLAGQWAVVGKVTGSGYGILPGPHDGHSDPFSNFDLAVECYHPWEDRHGYLARPASDHVQDVINGESTDGERLVTWYVAHLFHDISDHGRDWHEAGPDLIPIQVEPSSKPTVDAHV